MGQIQYAASGGIVFNQGKVLLLRQRHAHKSTKDLHPGSIEIREEVRLPKGHIEAEEKRAQTAMREVGEETGYHDLRIVADLGELTHSFNRHDGEVTRNESYFLMVLNDPTPQQRDPYEAELFDVVWVPIDQAEAIITFDVEREFLRRAIQVWQQMGHNPGEVS
ncbi:MAG: NUDIX domain-containing protein [Chloroflexi bacterium]|nr:NUDIX domain-containing protein [Chloroflexota bacterium]